MTDSDIARQRLVNQQLAGTTFEQAANVVAWLGAVQAQEYAGAKWAVAQRTWGLGEADLEQAFAEGSILRTHVMRPTWHFVTPADIRWMLTLTAPRVHGLNAYYYRKLELDEAVFTRSSTALEKALAGGKQLLRSELAAALQRAGIAGAADDRLRLAYILMWAELEGIICSGARRGKQHTYALLDERAPQASTIEQDAALAELARRYFTSHGPATLKDYIWWSGLPEAAARAGLEAVKPQLAEEAIDGRTHWFSPETPGVQGASPGAHLLPAFDEYTVSYKDHSAIIDGQYSKEVIYGNVVVIAGQIAGAWKRTLGKDSVQIAIRPFTPLAEAGERAVSTAAGRYGEFLDTQVVLEFE